MNINYKNSKKIKHMYCLFNLLINLKKIVLIFLLNNKL